MNEHTRIAAASRLGITAAVLAVVLSGCTTSSAPEEKANERAAAFIACLKAAGVEAMVGDQGHALVKQAPAEATDDDGDGVKDISISSDSAGANVLYAMGDDQGNFWVAMESSSGFTDDPDTQDAYAACEQQVPDFEQPEFDPFADPQMKESQEKMQQAGLDFARCARDEGFTWVRDPAQDEGGAIELPADLAEDEFRAMLEACYDPETPMGWVVSGELGFDFNAVLMEFGGGGGAGFVALGETE